MKKLLITAIYLSLCAQVFGQQKSTVDRSNNALAAPIVTGMAVGIAGLITAGIIYDRYIESIELDATELYLKSGKAANHFELQLMSNQVSSFKDLSNTTVLAFAITESEVNKDAASIYGVQNKVMLMYLHDGWITEGGVNFRYVTTELYDYEQWLKLYLACLNLVLTKPITNPDSIPLYQVAWGKNFTEFTGPKLEVGLKQYTLLPQTFNIRSRFLKLTDRGLYYPRGSSEEEYHLISPVIAAGDDQYLTTKFDDNTTLIYNEGKFGFYKNDVQRLVQLSTDAVMDITNFLTPKN